MVLPSAFINRLLAALGLCIICLAQARQMKADEIPQTIYFVVGAISYASIPDRFSVVEKRGGLTTVEIQSDGQRILATYRPSEINSVRFTAHSRFAVQRIVRKAGSRFQVSAKLNSDANPITVMFELSVDPESWGYDKLDILSATSAELSSLGVCKATSTTVECVPILVVK